MKKEKGLCNEKQMSFDDFLINNFKSKLDDLSLSLLKTGTGKPLILYTTLLDESDEYGEQELAIINENYVVIQVITFGGFVPMAVQHQRVFTFEEFSIWVFKRSASLFLQCLSTIDDALVSINR
ncbi:MAG: hypothetical protein M3M88_01315 [Thermoproteota archaeon]|nr:hypothetical protein [Thermoproteota archaeon]